MVSSDFVLWLLHLLQPKSLLALLVVLYFSETSLHLFSCKPSDLTFHPLVRGPTSRCITWFRLYWWRSFWSFWLSWRFPPVWAEWLVPHLKIKQYGYCVFIDEHRSISFQEYHTLPKWNILCYCKCSLFVNIGLSGPQHPPEVKYSLLL